jgi:hypothetical protein
MVCSAQTVHLSCVKISTMSKWTENEVPLGPCHLGVPSGESKAISEPMVLLAQTVHLSCTGTNTTDRNEISHDPHHIGVPFGASKMILSLWYIWHKPCTYLVSRLALPPNGSKRDSTWPKSPSSSIVCVQNIFRAYGTLCANRTPI